MDDYLTKYRKAAAMLKALMEKQQDLGLTVKEMSDYSKICEDISDRVTDIIDRKGFDCLFNDPVALRKAIDGEGETRKRIADAFVYAVMSGVGRENRSSISAVRSTLESLPLNKAMIYFLDLIFSSIWEKFFLKDADKREWGGLEVFCFKPWDTEFCGGAVWTSQDGKRKVVSNFTCRVKFKAENMSILMADLGDDHYASADAIAVKYKKGLEEFISADFKQWCQSGKNPPKAENYDLLRGPAALHFYLGDHGLEALTASFDAHSRDMEEADTE